MLSHQIPPHLQTQTLPQILILTAAVVAQTHRAAVTPHLAVTAAVTQVFNTSSTTVWFSFISFSDMFITLFVYTSFEENLAIGSGHFSVLKTNHFFLTLSFKILNISQGNLF